MVLDGEVCFWYRGESESCCDHFYFRIDGTSEMSASGTVSTWTRQCSPVTAGSQTVRWEYDKDYSVDTGADRFTIDDVTFPMTLEECDDGGTAAGDGCNSNCLNE